MGWVTCSGKREAGNGKWRTLGMPLYTRWASPRFSVLNRFPVSRFPVSLQQPSLILVPPRSLVARTAACLIRLRSTHLNHWRVVACRAALHQSLVPARRRPAEDADGVELVHHLRHRHELRHRAKRLPAKVRVGAREDYPATAGREGCRDLHDRIVKELRFVDRDHLCERIQALRDLR